MKRILLILLLALIVPIQTGCDSASDRAAAQFPPQKTEVASVVPEPWIDGERIKFDLADPQLGLLKVEPGQPRQSAELHFNGRLLWNDEATANVFTPVAGHVKKILVALGQHVEEGSPLAIIESPDLGQAQADARRAASDFALAERTLSRTKEIFDHGAAPRKDVESAQADYDNKFAEKERTAARLALLGGKPGAVDQMYTLRSPIAGVVVDKNISPGMEVRSDQILASANQWCAPHFVISDPTRLWVQLDSTEKDMPLLKQGQPLSITATAYPGQTFQGRIALVGDALDPATRTIKIRGVVENPNRLLKAEMYVGVDVHLADQTLAGVNVPAKAMFMKGDQRYVFVEEARGQYARRPVTAGNECNDQIVVLQGLAAGTPVVSQGALLLESMLETKGNS